MACPLDKNKLKTAIDQAVQQLPELDLSLDSAKLSLSEKIITNYPVSEEEKATIEHNKKFCAELGKWGL